MVKRILALSLLMVGLLGVSGCGDGGDAGPAAQELHNTDKYMDRITIPPSDVWAVK